MAAVVGEAARLGLADHVADEALTVDALAARAGAAPAVLARMLTVLVQVGLFTVEDGAYRTTPDGARLCEGHPDSMRWFCQLAAGDYRVHVERPAVERAAAGPDPDHGRRAAGDAALARAVLVRGLGRRSARTALDGLVLARDLSRRHAAAREHHDAVGPRHLRARLGRVPVVGLGWGRPLRMGGRVRRVAAGRRHPHGWPDLVPARRVRLRGHCHDAGDVHLHAVGDERRTERHAGVHDARGDAAAARQLPAARRVPRTAVCLRLHGQRAWRDLGVLVVVACARLRPPASRCRRRGT